MRALVRLFLLAAVSLVMPVQSQGQGSYVTLSYKIYVRTYARRYCTIIALVPPTRVYGSLSKKHAARIIIQGLASHTKPYPIEFINYM